jgi:hypothetical protein
VWSLCDREVLLLRRATSIESEALHD